MLVSLLYSIVLVCTSASTVKIKWTEVFFAFLRLQTACVNYKYYYGYIFSLKINIKIINTTDLPVKLLQIQHYY